MNIIKILGVAAGIAVAGLAGLAITNPGNVAQTSADNKDENLKTRLYRIDLKTFVEQTEKLLPSLTTYGRNWKLVSANVYGNSANIKAEIPVVFFTDDLEIKVNEADDNKKITIDVRSNSRVGNSDLGENRRHVLQLLKALDEKFSGK